MTSRVARKPIKIPAGVDIKLADQSVVVKGKLGELKKALPEAVTVVHADGEMRVSASNDTKASDAKAGTMRAILQNMITGVSEGFKKELVLMGVGYRAKVQGSHLDLTVGFSHPVVIPMPKGITVETPSNTEITLKGADNHLLSQVAANIRAIRPPEPYKGKGIRYKNETVILKEGKKK